MLHSTGKQKKNLRKQLLKVTVPPKPFQSDLLVLSVKPLTCTKHAPIFYHLRRRGFLIPSLQQRTLICLKPPALQPIFSQFFHSYRYSFITSDTFFTSSNLLAHASSPVFYNLHCSCLLTLVLKCFNLFISPL